MGKLTKNQKLAAEKIEAGKAYSLKEAAQLVKDITFTKFDASLDIDVRLGVDPRKANQMVRGVVSLPHGTGKQVRVLVLCTPDAEAAAKEAGADYVGLDEYIEKIKGGWTDIDVIITMPSIMGKIGALGRVLGPRGLMPNPKSGTVTMDVAKAVKEVKQGKIDFKVDKSGIVHTSIGKVSFTADQIRDNAKEFIATIIKLKPTAAKGTYIKSIYLSSTMSAGIKIDPENCRRKLIKGGIMRKEDKGRYYWSVADTVKEYGHFYLVDTTAMDAAKTSELRRKCFKAGIKLVVVKNTLLHKALMSMEGVDFSPLFDSLKGTTSVMFSEVANAPAKLLKEYKEEIPALKAAYAEEGFYVGADQLDALAILRVRMKLLLILLHCCNHRRKMLFLLFNQVVTPFMEFLKTLGERAE